MKKLVGALAGLICYVCLSVSAKADVIWEPEDSFYSKHAEECTYVNRQFTANGPDNKVIVYKSPELPQEVDIWENGRRVNIIFTYEDSEGKVWGVYDDYRGNTGWMPMDYMTVVYDSISFAEDHEDQIIEETGSLDGKYLGMEVYFWEYPGAETYNSIKTESYAPEYRSLYIDGKGNRWGNIGYYFGIKNAWICLDQPTADFEQIFPEGVPDGDRSSEEQNGDAVESESQETERIVPRLNRGLVAAAVILVIFVVAVTIVLLNKLKKGSR